MTKYQNIIAFCSYRECVSLKPLESNLKEMRIWLWDSMRRYRPSRCLYGANYSRK